MLIHKIRLVIAMVLCSSVLATVDVSEAQNLATVVVQVSDTNGAAVENAQAELVNPVTGVSVSAASNGAGALQFGSVAPGHYLLTVQAPGFAVYHAETDIGLGQSSVLDVHLTLSSTLETITVSAEDYPVYNAIVSPNAGVRPLKLLAGKKTSMRFYIGPQDAKNALSVDLWTVNPKILARKGILPLTVTMTCLPCENHRTQSQAITYSGKERRSSEARFYFVPQHYHSAGGMDDPIITIAITSKGQSYDHLVVPVEVVDASTTSSAQVQPDALLGTKFSVPDAVSIIPDVILSVARQASGELSVEVEPIHPDLVKRFKTRHLYHGQPRSFVVSAANVKAMQAAAEATALVLRGIVDQKDAALQEALSKTQQGIPDARLVDDLKLSQEDLISVLESFYTMGSLTYFELFQDATLRELMTQVATFVPTPSRAPRILIRTVEVSFPWQLLHDDRVKMNPDEFWGLRYDITVDSLARPYGGVLPDGTIEAKTDVSVFGAYKAGQGELPTVSVQALKQADHFKIKFGLQTVPTPQSGLSLLQALKEKKDSIKFFLVFAHGSSGTIVEKLADGNIVLMDEAQGPRIMLSKDKNGIVSPLDLMRLPVGRAVEADAFFRQNPIVFLNACDTGTSSISRSMMSLTFPEALLRLGARGVIATEAPVWNFFAYDFGNDLIDEMSKGKEMSGSLRLIRLKYLSTYGNPFGLLYSYYGSANAHVVPQQENPKSH